MRWAGKVVCMGEIRNAYFYFWKRQLRELGAIGMWMWTQVICPKIGPSDRIL